jgi:membrane protein insertase Oxa1/YidC/SpoIIIJ
LATIWHDAVLRPVVWLLTQFHDLFARGSLTERAGAFGLAIVASTLVIRLALAPLAVALAAVGRRSAMWEQQQRSMESLFRQVLADDPAQLDKGLAVLRRRRRRHIAVRLASWPLGIASVAIQSLVVIALYYAIADVARQLASGDLAFAGIGNITHTAIDVCCTLMRDGKPVVDAAGTPQHGDVVSGLLHNPGAAAIAVVAALLTMVQSALTQPRITGEMSANQRRATRATRQTSAIIPLTVVGAAVLLPEAVGLALATQTAWLVLQGWALRRWLTASRQPRGDPAADALSPVSAKRDAAL